MTGSPTRIADLLELARKGHDVGALVELAGDRGIGSSDTTVAKLLKFDLKASRGSALERLDQDEDPAAVRRRRAKRLGKRWDVGAMRRLGREASADVEFEAMLAAGRQRRAVQRALDAEEAGAEDQGDDYADVAALLEAGVERRVPDAGGFRSDGVRLSYRGAVNGLVGPPESGKTLVAIAQACDELIHGATS